MASLQTACIQIQKLIANGQLKDALIELNRFAEHSSFLSEAIQQQARFSRLREKVRMGTLDWSEESMTQNQISASILELLDLWKVSGEKTSTSKAFEREVIQLIGQMGFDVIPKFQLASKKVDFLATEFDRFGKTKQYLGECKCYNSLLTKDELVKIIVDYGTHLNSGYNLLIVTKNGLAPAAQTYINDSHNVYHRTYHDLLNATMDFTSYVHGSKATYQLGDLSKNYIAQGFYEGKGSIEAYIEKWIESEDFNPLAVLGGYGMGKTTLALRLGYTQARKHEDNPQERIPIIIKLEDLSNESTLEGLLGKLFTSVNVIRNYNFPLFMKLNEDGKFLIILDGFDEMKRTMSEDALFFNFEQLNRLVSKKSKVILLGRPTVFLNKMEQKEILQGSRFDSKRPVGSSGRSNFTELNIKPFSKEQIELFLSKSLKNTTAKSNRNADSITLESYVSSLNEMDIRHLVEIASRPVQLKMLTEILPFHEGEISAITVTILYSEFIDLITRRESNKIARSDFRYSDRRAFASSLAYWMWKKDLGAEVDSSAIDKKLFMKYIQNGKTFEEVKRDLLLGCFLEKKQPSGLYFPHRTFQEFLVAEEINNIIKTGVLILDDCPFLTPEIKSFFIEIIGLIDLKKWRRSVIENPNSVNENSRDLLNTACAYYLIKQTFDPSKKREGELPTSKKRSVQSKFGIEPEILLATTIPKPKPISKKLNRDNKRYTNDSNRKASK